MRQLVSQFFVGRNGLDLLNKIVFAAAVILWIASRFVSGGRGTLLFYLFL